MRKTVVLLLVFLVAISTVACSIHRYRDLHLSQALNRTLSAAMDTSATDADIRSYLHDARLQIKTRKDAEVIRKLETAIWYADRATVPSYDLDKLMDDELSASYDHTRYLKAALLCAQRVHCSDAEVKSARDDQERDEAQLRLDRQNMDRDTKSAEEAKTASSKLLQEIRADLGLPPISK